MKNYLEQARRRLHDFEHEITTRTKGRFDGLMDKQREARERLNALETANKDRWDILRQGFEDAWHELEAAYDAVREDVQTSHREPTASERTTHP